MKQATLAQNIVSLRKQKSVTQEQLAAALNVSPQAISKWETEVCLPDTQMLPRIADFFGVSIDYLFYGEDITYDDIYAKVFQKVSGCPQMSEASFDNALRAFASANYGLIHGSLKSRDNSISDEPFHISNENGLSLLSGKGYGAILTRPFFESITPATADFAAKILPALSDRTCFLVCMAIISMSDICFPELQEKLGISDDVLRSALDKLIDAGLVEEKASKHKALGSTYDIASMYHTCLCILAATIEMQRFSLANGISCCMGYGDYPIRF